MVWEMEKSIQKVKEDEASRMYKYISFMLLNQTTGLDPSQVH